jgi:hypothetical protein
MTRASKINLELGPYLFRCGSRLPRTASIREQAGVKNKSKCNIDNHSIAVSFSSSHRKSLSILDLLKERLDRLVRNDRLVRIIFCIELLVVYVSSVVAIIE